MYRFFFCRCLIAYIHQYLSSIQIRHFNKSDSCRLFVDFWFMFSGTKSPNHKSPNKTCGESRIRTYEGVRQQIYSLPQLATLVSPPNQTSRWRDSNPRPADYKSAALANWATSAIPSEIGSQMYNILFITQNYFIDLLGDTKESHKGI